MSLVKVIAPAGRRKFYVLRWTDPTNGQPRQESTKSTSLRTAERMAGEKEADILQGRWTAPSTISWEQARQRYEAEALPNLSPRTAEPKAAAMNHIEAILKPRKLADVTAERLSYFQSKLRDQELADTTIAGHLAHLGGFFAWAVSVGMIPKAPRIPKIKAARQGKGKVRFMKGRPITGEEFDRLLAAVDVARPQDATEWRRYLNGLWLSGLRLSESIDLSWDADARFSIDTSGRHPRFKIHSTAQKSREDEFLPMVPDFWEFIKKTPNKQCAGRVFKLDGLMSGEPVTVKTVGRLVSKFGKNAKVVVNKAEGKYASAHDLRRSFGTRWAVKVMPVVLQRLMRHKTIETTLRYYVGLDADDLAERLWSDYLSVARQSSAGKSQKGGLGDTSGDTKPKKATRRGKAVAEKPIGK